MIEIAETIDSSRQCDCPETRERREKREPYLFELGDLSLGKVTHSHLYLGQQPGLGERASVIYLTEVAGKKCIWIDADLRDHPCLHHYQGRLPDSCFTIRTELGWRDEETYLVRCAADPNGAHHVCLPTARESDEFVIYYELQSALAWARETGGDWLQLPAFDPRIKGGLIPAKIENGWNFYEDPRTGTVWLREPMKTSNEAQP